MAKQVINNGDIGLTARGKINDNFTELYDGKQPLDSDLTAIAALSTTAFGRGLLALADAAALQASAGTVIGTNVQAYDADLTTLGAGGAGARTFLGLAIGTDVQAYDADLTAVADSGAASAWTTYVPTVTAGTGTFTTVVGAGRYLKIGKLVNFYVQITITTNGTAASFINCTLPFATRNVGTYASQTAVGKEVQAAGTMCTCELPNNSSTMTITDYSLGYPGGSGRTVVVSGAYECA